MVRTIKVTGKGKFSVRPDTICLKMCIRDLCDTYEDAIDQSGKRSDELREAISVLGFQKSDLKTLDFGIDMKYDRFQEDSKRWKREFQGYQYTHSIKLEFDSNNQLLGKVLRVLRGIPFHPEILIEYTVKDQEAAKCELLKQAVKDSRRKAEVLCEAAGVSLGEIITIDYSWGGLSLYSKLLDMTLDSDCEDDCVFQDEDLSLNIEPDDISVSDTVTIIWGIE